ncbi:MAG TPA: lipopolysaccharide assembly protein LapA domain-containing protein [Burkholderiales bacterium]|jgi:uncharacterized integral membrane protein
MRYLSWITRLVLFLLLLGFALKNTEPVALRYFLGQEWRAPLSLVLLLFFGAGAALGAAAVFGVAWRLRRELDAQQRGAGSAPKGRAEPTDVTAV